MKVTNKVYSLEDLEKWDFDGVSLALIGNPVGFSLSPIMHNAALEEMAKEDPRFSLWRYFKFDITPPYLPQALELFHLKHFLGINLTLPHKISVIKLIESMDEVARKMGAINSLVFESSGYRGFNTDGYGFEAAVKYNLGISLKGKKIILLGAGGAAKAAAIQCLLAECSELWIGNRTQERLEDLLKSLGIMGKGKVHGFKLGQIPEGLPKIGLLINATALGLYEEDEIPMQLDYFDASLKVYDMIYRSGPTELIRIAESRGMKACSGLRMLVEQGARALQVWTGRKAPIDVMWKAVTNIEKVMDFEA